MKRFNAVTKLIAVLALVNLIAPRMAYAYLDPGTGSYILQLLLGVFVGAMFAIKIFWKNIKGYFASAFQNRQKDERNDD